MVMKLRYKSQDFQSDATNAICNAFIGQPKQRAQSYILDPGQSNDNTDDLFRFDAYANPALVINNDLLLENIVNQQIRAGLQPSEKLLGRGINLTVEMETGTGKTYTYTKTMYELNKLYGWSKFIVIVPSVAIREGVYKSFQSTAEHFKEQYGKAIRFFIYNSAHPNDIEAFATDSNINVMIINMQAFASRGEDARRIYMKLDTFRSRRPIDVIAATHPILILDEPQSMGGPVVTDMMNKFNPLFILRYSATHRETFNMVYRLDALDAYNRKLVKKISVKGVSVIGNTATNSYVYVSKINVFPNKNPTVTMEVDYQNATQVTKRTFNFERGDNLYDKSNKLQEYKDRWVITDIDARDNSVRFENGQTLYVGDVIGDRNQEQVRRIQIRETINAHLEQEEKLFNRGIKVLSLFFIGEVAKYRTQDDQGGLYAQMFEQEYADAVADRLSQLGLNPEYESFLKQTDAHKAHAGYFSIDKKGKFQDSKLGRSETSASKDGDIAAYDLIMKDKERLLSREEPVRFIFSHSALREGWDNPNVFQICALKTSDNNVSRRQELGRGMRLCVNQNGDRMDYSVLGESVHKLNVLTVIASESYEKFAKGLQVEYDDDLKSRPRIVTQQLFKQAIRLETGEMRPITEEESRRIYNHFIRQDYIDDNGNLTAKFHDARQAGTLVMPDGFPAEEIIRIAESVYKPIEIENRNKTRVKIELNTKNFEKREFQELWARINQKSAYTVDFEAKELEENAIKKLDDELHVTPVTVVVTGGEITAITEDGFVEDGQTARRTVVKTAEVDLKYDLIGKIAEGTQLTRKCVANILCGIRKETFEQFKQNPQDFITKAIGLINGEKATTVVQHVTYSALDDRYDTSIFTDSDTRALADKTVETPKNHIYNYVVADSNIEREMAAELERQEDVCVYAKLPRGFEISTPVGKYNPDWAIAFKQGTVKHIYFVAETKGQLQSLNFGTMANTNPIEQTKIDCAKKHFKAISGENVKYGVVTRYDELLELVQLKG
jgi:type III restriction enzyme